MASIDALHQQDGQGQPSHDLVDENGLWSAQMEWLFIEIMVDEVNKGNLKDRIFNPSTWTTILLEMNVKSGRRYQMKQIKAKFHQLRTKHRAFSDLLNQSGFGWDPSTNTVTAVEEVWANYLKAHPFAHQFKKKGCENYAQLGVIFNTGTATGVLRHASTMSPPNTDEENELESQYRHSGIHVDLDSDLHEDPFQNDLLGSKNRSGKRLSPIPNKGGKKRSKIGGVSNAIQAFVELQNAKTEKLKASSFEATSAPYDDTLSACMKILNELPYPINKRVKAMTMFTMPEWRKVFLEMSEELREG